MPLILGITPTTPIPKPIGARIVVVPIQTTLSIEQRFENAGLVLVAADEEKPRLSYGIIVKTSIDPLIAENFRVGMGVYFGGLSGTDMIKRGKVFRSFDFGEILGTDEEDEVDEEYKDYVRSFLTSSAELKREDL